MFKRLTIGKPKKLLKIIGQLFISVFVRIVSLVLSPWRLFRIKRFRRGQNDIKEILVMYMGEGLGDNIIFSGVLPSIRERFPDSKINILIFKRFEEYFKGNPYIDRIFAYPDYRYVKGGLKEFLAYSRYVNRHCNPDILIDLLPSRFIKPAIFSSFLPKRLSIGFDHLIKKLFFDIAVKIDWDKYFYDVIFDALKPLRISRCEARYWIPQLPLDQRLSIKNDFKTKTVVLAPGGKFNLLKPQEYGGFRNYPELATRLVENGYRVILVGAVYDMDSQFFGNNFPKDKFINLLAKTSIGQLFALIKDHADLVICNTSGLLYVALAVGVPAVFYAHPLENLKRWHPSPNDGRYFVLQETVENPVTVENFFQAIVESINLRENQDVRGRLS